MMLGEQNKQYTAPPPIRKGARGRFLAVFSMKVLFMICTDCLVPTQAMVAMTAAGSAVELGLGSGNVKVWKSGGTALVSATAPWGKAASADVYVMGDLLVPAGPGTAEHAHRPGQFGQPKVGTPCYNDASSAIGAPTLSLPLLTVDELPLGVQIMGFEYEDAELVAMARWIIGRFAPQLA
jgi:hypothetical protein